MMTHMQAYKRLAALETNAMECGGEYQRFYGTGVPMLVIRQTGPFEFTYQWGERMVEKSTALHFVQFYDVQESR